MEMEQQNNELEGLYLRRDLRAMGKKAGQLVYANYVCDENEVIARRDEGGEFQVAKELKNMSDWGRFQELTAQADAIITGSGYLKRYAKHGEGAENVIDQFAKGGSFEKLGDWREAHKLRRNPDIAIVSRNLDFEIPAEALKDRKVFVFTTYDKGSSDRARELRDKQQAYVIGVGVDGVDGKKMVDFLVGQGDRIIKMTTGPRVLKILLDAGVLDELYVTRVHRQIDAKPEDTQTILGADKKIKDLENFVKAPNPYHQEDVITEDGEHTSQDFEIYDNKAFLAKLA